MIPVKLNKSSTAEFPHALCWKCTSNGIWTNFPPWVFLCEFFSVSFLPFMLLKIAAQFGYFAVTVSLFLNHVVFLLNWIPMELLCMLWWIWQKVLTYTIGLHNCHHLPNWILTLLICGRFCKFTYCLHFFLTILFLHFASCFSLSALLLPTFYLLAWFSSQLHNQHSIFSLYINRLHVSKAFIRSF